MIRAIVAHSFYCYERCGMSAMQSEGGSKSALQYCTDLQILLNMTLDYVLIPLRNELKKSHDYSDILDLEIQDGEV